MKTAPIVAARIERDAQGLPYAPDFGDVYHPRGGALEQARHVFLAGNGLPARWSGRDRFVVLETGFGLGNNFLATWDAWRGDANRCDRLVFVSVERHPPRREDLATLHRGCALAPLAAQLVDAWPPLTWNLHRLAFEGGRVQLHLCLGDVRAWLPEIIARVDAFFLDGFAPARNPQMWEPHLFKALARLAAPDATAATWSAARVVRDGLAAAGFEVTRADGIAGKRDITTARFAPRFEPRAPVGRSSSSATAERRAVIVGGGLAGCAVAAALADVGWHSVVLDRHAEPACEASGNAGGLFHAIVHPHDGAHARFHRAAALQAHRTVRDAMARHGVAGQVDGLLRLQTDPGGLAALHTMLTTLGLPEDFVQALDADAASARAGLSLRAPAWFFPDAGWVEPGGLARAWLAGAGSRVRWRGQAPVDRLESTASGWRLVGRDGTTLEEASTVVLANAGDALRLLGRPPAPLTPVRGQVSRIDATALTSLGMPLPRRPVVGAGYVLPPIAGSLWFGATATPGDATADLRVDDHRTNLDQLEHLFGRTLDLPSSHLQGRAAVRWSSDDRLPLVGAVPAAEAWTGAAAHTSRLDQPRFVPRCAGLFVMTALGSRGIVSSTLGAQVLAAWIAGAPIPLEAGLIDAIDPARFVSRAARRAQR